MKQFLNYAVVLWIACLGRPCLLPSQALAQATAVAPATNSTKLPTAQAIMTRFVEELGGTNAFAKIDSQHMKGKFEMAGQGISGNLEVLAKRPDKLVIKISLPGIGDILQGFDGKVGWSLNPITGPMLLEGKMLEQVKEQARFDGVLHDPSQFVSAETVDRFTFEGQDAFRIKLVRKSGQEVTEYYDAVSGLLIGSTEVEETPLGALAVTASVGDYKKFGETRFATRLTQKMGPMAQVMRFETLEFNTVEAGAFELPGPIKALTAK